MRRATEEALFCTKVDEKLRLVTSIGKTKYEEKIGNKKNWEKPTYEYVCKSVNPRDVGKRRKLFTDEGLALFLHSIAHIEFFAIDLALDAIYRFDGLPDLYYEDWLEVAKEEVEHFIGIRKILNSLGYEYGDFNVHGGLFNAAIKTQSALERMALIPMGFEANGLDANIALRRKIEHNDPNHKDAILESLEVILRDEISHVKKGNVWFDFICKKEGRDREVFFEIVERHYPRLLKLNKELNVAARLEAGFSKEEIEILQQQRGGSSYE